jgi:16S rRNA (adenine1518-N6/adenine1519-N6)-dimethyltransferase
MVDITPEKDQHILTDCKELVKAAKLVKKDRVIEIGAGTGIITKELAKKAEKVLAFEIDKKFTEYLEPLKEKCPNLEIVYGNALDYGWKGYNKIVSNIPFSLSEPTILKAIAEETETLMLIVSESFKENLLSDSKIGVVTRLFFDVKPLSLLKKELFVPPPKTECWVVMLRRTKADSEADRILRNIVLSERKIKNAIIYAFVKIKKTKNRAREIIKKMDIDEKTLDKPAKKATAKFLLMLKEGLENKQI